MAQNKFCTKCGTPAVFDAVFCTNCGNKFPPVAPAQIAYDPEATVSLANPIQQQAPTAPTVSTFNPNTAPAAEATVNAAVNVPQSFIPDLKPIAPTVPEPAPAVAPVEEETVATAPAAAPAEEETVATAPAAAPAEEETVATAPVAAPVEEETVATAPAVAPVEEETVATAPAAAPAEEETVATAPAAAPVEEETVATAPVADNEATVSIGQSSDSHIPSNDVTISVNTPDVSNIRTHIENAASHIEDAVKPAKKKSSAGNVIATIISIILAIVLIVPVFATAMTGALQYQLSNEAIKDAVKLVDTYSFVKDNVFTEYTLGDTGYTGFTAYMYSIVYNNDNPVLPTEDYIDFEARLSDIFKNDAGVTMFVKGKLTGIRDDLKENKSDTTIEATEFTEIIRGLKDSLEAEFGVTITDQDFEKINTDISNSNFDKISLEAAKKGNRRVFEYISYALSDNTFYIMIAASVLLLLIVVFVNGKRFQKGLIIGGVSLGISGGATFALSVYLNTLLEYISIPSELLKNNIIRMFLGKMDDLSVYTTAFLELAGIIILGTAALLIVAGIIIAIVKCVSRKKKLKREGASQ